METQGGASSAPEPRGAVDGRARKRVESDDKLHAVKADKRACSSSGIKPPGPSSGETTDAPAPGAPASSDHHVADQDMESSSSVRSERGSFDGSSCSDGGEDDEEPDPDLDPGDDDDHHDDDHDHHSGGHGGGGGRYGCSMSREKMKSILSSLEDSAGCGAALTELCEALSFGSEDSLSNLVSDLFAPALVRLAGDDSNADTMLLAIRALTYLSDVLPRSAASIVKHGALPVLCGRLMSIEYLDVAEQAVQALEKISHYQQVPCLRAGVITAVLIYIDFFSTSIQRAALSTIVNVCKKLPSDCSSFLLEAIPTLCNLLNYDDEKIVETAAACLKKISENLSGSEFLDDMCKHGLVNQCANLIASSGRPPVSQATYHDLIRLLTRLASGSLVAFKALLELNISSTLRGILETADISHNVSYSFRVNGHADQVHEVLKLLTQLLPSRANEDKNIQLVLSKEKILVQEPKFLHQLGKDILPALIQVVNSGASSSVCYGCISLIHNMVYLSSSEMLLDFLRDVSFSSFLAGLLTRKDIHVLNSSLKTAQILLERQIDVFMGPFIKEGVVYAIDKLQLPENRTQVMAQPTLVPMTDSAQVAIQDISKCFCHVFSPCHAPSSQAETCGLGKETVLALAKQIRSTYFNTVLRESDLGFTDFLQKLKTLSGTLNENVERLPKNDCSQNEEHLTHVLKQMMMELDGAEPMSTFEFIESGIVRSLAYYLSNGMYFEGQMDGSDSQSHFSIILKRFQTFASICLLKSGQNPDNMLLALLVRKLQNALSSFDQFPVVLSLGYKHRNVYADVPYGHSTKQPCLKVHFVSEDESIVNGYSESVLAVESSSSLHAIEEFLRPKISTEHTEQCGEESAENGTCRSNKHPSSEPKDKKDPVLGGKCADGRTCEKHGKVIDEPQSLASCLLEVSINQDLPLSPAAAGSMMEVEQMTNPSGKRTGSILHVKGDASPKLLFYLEGEQLDHYLTLYQAVLQQRLNAEPDMVVGPKFWNDVYKVTYRSADPNESNPRRSPSFNACSTFPWDKTLLAWSKLPFFSCMLDAKLPCTLDKSKPSYDILFMLKVLEGVNQVAHKLLLYEKINAFAEGGILNLDDLKMMTVSAVPQLEFLSSKLTEKLEQQMRDPLSLSSGSMPPWCSQLMATCPFLFSFEARWKYFSLSAFGSSRVQQTPVPQRDNSSNAINYGTDLRSQHSGNSARKRFGVDRNNVLESATKIMSSHAHREAILDVEFFEEVGIGLGPTLEFYTLVSREFQKIGLGMWRGDHSSVTSLGAGGSGHVAAPLGLFPRPWSTATSSSNSIQFTNVIQQFVLLGQIVAKALKDGRVLDLPFSKAFYMLMLQKELDVYDIQSFDPQLGTTLLEFRALVHRRRFLESISGKNEGTESDLDYRGTSIQDLCLDFTLPGHSDYLLASRSNSDLVNIVNLEEYVSLIVDATLGSGISRQIEAFKSGFNEVFPMKALQIFTEDELEHLLCGEQNSWTFSELLDHIRFDHGYTATSPPVISFLETIQEFEFDQRRAFLQFVTGAPRLPPGGLAALNPKLTVVRKHCSDCTDMELPSVMTCANYLKLPPYSSKEKMQEKLLYAITEGQGSFHLS
uniref:HECT-type E3 ubiquitin transferase n=1 Tax=Anthurium amnicola TaxID=1678845 RepID=A0A1D1YN22_9ARAE